MRKLARLSDTSNENRVIFEVLDDMIDGIDAFDLDPTDARYLLFYIRAISLTDPNFYLRFTCTHERTDGSECGAVNPFAFTASDLQLVRVNKSFETQKEIVIREKRYLFGIYGTSRESEVEEIISEYIDSETSKNGSVDADELTMYISDVKMSAYLLEVDGVRVSVLDAMKYISNMPYSEIREVGLFMAQIPNYGFNDKVKKKCHSCGKETMVSIPLSRLFFFSKPND